MLPISDSDCLPHNSAKTKRESKIKNPMKLLKFLLLVEIASAGTIRGLLLDSLDSISSSALAHRVLSSMVSIGEDVDCIKDSENVLCAGTMGGAGGKKKKDDGNMPPRRMMTNAPSPSPTPGPSPAPSPGPSPAPSTNPTSAPSQRPTQVPTIAAPTAAPTESPEPTPTPSAAPTGVSPTESPAPSTSSCGTSGSSCIVSLPSPSPGDLDVEGCGKMISSLENQATITMGMDATLPWFSVSSEVSFTIAKKVELAAAVCNTGDEPLTRKVGGKCVLCTDMKLKCSRTCTITTTDTAKGNVKMWVVTAGAAQIGSKAGVASKIVTTTVPAGTVVSNIDDICRDYLNSLDTGSMKSICDEAQVFFKAQNEWRYIANCGNKPDGDAFCETELTISSVDAWTNSKCVLQTATSAEDRIGWCKLYSIKDGGCSGTCSNGYFEYPCDVGLTCTKVEDYTYFWTICWTTGEYRCL